MLPQVPYPHIHVHVCQTAFLLAMAKPMHACLSKPVPMRCLDPCSSPVSSLQTPGHVPLPPVPSFEHFQGTTTRSLTPTPNHTRLAECPVFLSSCGPARPPAHPPASLSGMCCRRLLHPQTLIVPPATSLHPFLDHAFFSSASVTADKSLISSASVTANYRLYFPYGQFLAPVTTGTRCLPLSLPVPCLLDASPDSLDPRPRREDRFETRRRAARSDVPAFPTDSLPV